MDLLERLREAQADTKRDMRRTDLRTKDVLLLSDIADVFGECADEIERLSEALHKLIDAADDSDGCQYGTLSTSFVRDNAKVGLGKRGEMR